MSRDTLRYLLRTLFAEGALAPAVMKEANLCFACLNDLYPRRSYVQRYKSLMFQTPAINRRRDGPLTRLKAAP